MSGEQENNNAMEEEVPQIGMYGAEEEAAPAPQAEAAPAPLESTTSAIAEVSNMPETLHMAARAGTVDSVKMLIRNGADPEGKDIDGKTALQYAQEAGKDDIVKYLQEVMDAKLESSMDANRKDAEPEDKYGDSFEEEASPVQSPTAAAAPPAEAAAGIPAVQIDAPAADNAIQEDIGNSPEQGYPSPGNRSPGASSRQKSPTGASGKGDDLKARTMFSMSTTDGVLKRTTFISSLSTYQSAPQISIASRGGSMFMRSMQGPSPGSYNLPDDEKSKFKTSARFSFGGGSRFGLGGSPAKLQPGPGAYNPKDPSLYVDTKVGFGTSVRNKSGEGPQANPGPGAYTPTLAGAYQTSPKCGFGTSTRGNFGGGGGRGQPGPGTYEMQNWKRVGTDSSKFSATSRRRMHDLNSYVTPGPGTYNAHATSFGSPGAYSCKHVDEGYKSRQDLRDATL